MYIGAIQQYNSSPSFKSGRTTLYTDFDGTFMPFSHEDVCNNDCFNKQNDFYRMHGGIDYFFSSFKDKVKLIITTGRSKNEYDYFVKNLEQKNLYIHKPQALITRDGSSRYNCTNNEIKEDTVRNNPIKESINLKDINFLSNNIKKIVKRIYPSAYIVEPGVNKNRHEYGHKSLEYVLDKSDFDDKNSYISISEPEPLVIEMAVSKKYDVNSIAKSIKDFVDANNIKVSVNAFEDDPFNFLPIYTTNGKQYKKADTIIIKPLIEGSEITKLYDVKNEIRKNIENNTNDFVVAAGDGFNDEPMLNPLNYLDLYGVKIDKNKSIEEILSDNDTLEALKKLPFCAIVCSNEKALDNIRKIGQILDSKGIYKVKSTDNPREFLLKNLKQAINDYGETNDEFMFSLGPDLYCSLFDN
ncbi:MAG TPA: hypothetical protein IAD26_01970 [Candidatus Limenecus avicola]|uniref:Uncharacterized protein n=1 Tax=Candidatus Limenecus avicola TaxID=2840847 RepID=A0A9D1SQC7_9CLOT|nr:hypothetical protein [Candidatus Limenecus avicola]